MAQFAPELPTTQQLEEMHAVEFDNSRVLQLRAQTSDILRNAQNGLVVLAGPCAFVGDPAQLQQESAALDSLHRNNSGLVTLQRRNFWKPRSNPADWHGPETTEPEETHRQIVHGAMAHANGAAELANMDHLDRYGKFLTLGWFGARNEDLDEQIQIAQSDLSLPLGFKNSTRGKIDEALDTIAVLNEARGSGAAPVVLIYRGGDDATTPEAWEEQVKYAISRTMGSMIIDLAHGGEMAHDPNGMFQKTVPGQIACAEHVIKLAMDGHMAAGYMTEASVVESPTDPNMPFDVAIQTISALHRIRS